MSEVKYDTLLIHDMLVEERPRERLMSVGADNLSNSELLAIILRTGTARLSAIQLAQKLLHQFGDLRAIDNASVEGLTAAVDGIGPAKGCQLKAAFTLGKRLALRDGSVPVTLNSPQSVANLVMEDLRYQQREHFRILFLNTRNQVTGQHYEVSKGSLDASVVHPRETFKEAISRSAAGIILVHNHPSGDPSPSKEDIAITKRLCEGGEILGVKVLDHIIIGDGIFVSLKDRGLM